MSILPRYKSDKKLVSSASIDVVKDGSRHAILLKKVALDSAGSYTVRAINMAGEVFGMAILKVNGWCNDVYLISSDFLC